MGAARLRSWWQQIKQRRVTIMVIAIVLVVYIVIGLFIAIGSSFDWTGFGSYTHVTVQTTFSSTSKPTVTRTEDLVPGKTLWDWLNLFLLSLVTILAAFLTNAYSNRQKGTELDIASDKRREDSLQSYIDKISELLLEKQLRESDSNAEVRKIAGVRTLTVLRGLDPIRKASVLQFLYESGLIEKDNRIVDLSYADLSSANLYAFDLSGANLSKVNLREVKLFLADLSGINLHLATLTAANLHQANLRGANLEKAFLDGADLSFADLSGANLSEAILYNADLKGTKNITTEELETQTKSLQGATMPDGSIHP